MAEEGDGAWAREPRRLFLAVLPTPEVRAALVASQRALAPALRRGAPAAPGNLHLTLAFLGMCDASQEAAAARAYSRVVTPLALASRSLALFIPTGTFTEMTAVPSDESGGRP